MGDVGRGMFVRPGIPEFMRDSVVPKADIITPNHFELDFLAGRETHSLDEILDAVDVVRDRGPRDVLVTSVLHDDLADDALDVVAVSDDGAWAVTTPLLPISPNGGGDITAALYLAHLHTSGSPADRARRHHVVGVRGPRGDARGRHPRAPARRGPGRDRRAAARTSRCGSCDETTPPGPAARRSSSTACGGDDATAARPQLTATDAEFATELLHRDAALLNLLDVSLGRDLDPGLAATGEQQRIDANERMTTALRAARGVGRGGPGHLPRPRCGAQQRRRRTGSRRDADRRRPPGARRSSTGQAFVDEYVALLTTALEATRAFAEDHEGREAAADELAQAAVASSRDRARRALTRPDREGTEV